MDIEKIKQVDTGKNQAYDLCVGEITTFIDMAHKDGKLDINAVFEMICIVYKYGLMRGQNKAKNDAKKKAK